MLSIGVFWPAAGVVARAVADVAAVGLTAAEGAKVGLADTDGAMVGLADDATGGDKTAAAACGENGDAATSRVVTTPAPART